MYRVRHIVFCEMQPDKTHAISSCGSARRSRSSVATSLWFSCARYHLLPDKAGNHHGALLCHCILCLCQLVSSALADPETHKFIAGPVLTMSREFNSVINNSQLNCIIGTVFEIGCPTAEIYQLLHTTFSGQFTIKRITRDAHNLASPGNVTQFLSKIKQTGFVFNDGIVSMKHESYLVFCIRIRHPDQNW